MNTVGEIEECKTLLDNGIAALHLELGEDQRNQLMSYLALLVKWNFVYNLTSVRNPRDMVTQHLVDSLSVVSVFKQATAILDVGSGGGLPGIVLAIVYPDKRVDLIDTVNKKTAFLKQVKAELMLKNVTVHTGRVEQLSNSNLFDVITSRAFSELTNFVNWSGHLLADQGNMIALKGKLPSGEIEQLPDKWKITEIREIHVPGMDAERHLIWLSK